MVEPILEENLLELSIACLILSDDEIFSQKMFKWVMVEPILEENRLELLSDFWVAMRYFSTENVQVSYGWNPL